MGGRGDKALRHFGAAFSTWRGAALSGALHGGVVAAFTLSFPFLIGRDEQPAAGATSSEVPEAQVLPLVLSPDATLAGWEPSDTREPGDERIIALDIVYAEPGSLTSPHPFDHTQASATTARDRPAPAPDPRVAELAAEIQARTAGPLASLEAIDTLLEHELAARVREAEVAGRAGDLDEAAKQGSASAHAALGALAESRGADDDAVTHYRAAAAQGRVDAALRLGNLLAGGAAADRVEALAAWLVAAEAGDPIAASGARLLSALMSASDQATARTLAVRELAPRMASRQMTLAAGEPAALEQLAAAGDTAAVQALLERGALPSAAALHAAAESGQRDVVEALLAHGAEVDAADSEGRTALMRAAVRGDDALALGLLRRGADVNKRDQYGRSALTDAAWSGRPLLVGLLIELGADADAPTRDGATPLMWAAVNGHAAVVRLLVEHGAAIDARDAEGCTPLIRAAWNGHGDVVRALVEAGADPSARALDGQTARARAEASGYAAVAELLAAR